MEGGTVRPDKKILRGKGSYSSVFATRDDPTRCTKVFSPEEGTERSAPHLGEHCIREVSTYAWFHYASRQKGVLDRLKSMHTKEFVKNVWWTPPSHSGEKHANIDLAMPFISGDSAFKFRHEWDVDLNGGWAPEHRTARARALDFIRELVESLCDTQQIFGILHREPTPPNIMVDGLDRPFVIDWGCAAMEEDAWFSTVKKPEAVDFTRHAMACVQRGGGGGGPAPEKRKEMRMIRLPTHCPHLNQYACNLMFRPPEVLALTQFEEPLQPLVIQGDHHDMFVVGMTLLFVLSRGGVSLHKVRSSRVRGENNECRLSHRSYAHRLTRFSPGGPSPAKLDAQRGCECIYSMTEDEMVSAKRADRGLELIEATFGEDVLRLVSEMVSWLPESRPSLEDVLRRISHMSKPAPELDFPFLEPSPLMDLFPFGNDIVSLADLPASMIDLVVSPPKDAPEEKSDDASRHGSGKKRPSLDVPPGDDGQALPIDSALDPWRFESLRVAPRVHRLDCSRSLVFCKKRPKSDVNPYQTRCETIKLLWRWWCVTMKSNVRTYFTAIEILDLVLSRPVKIELGLGDREREPELFPVVIAFVSLYCATAIHETSRWNFRVLWNKLRRDQNLGAEFEAREVQDRLAALASRVFYEDMECSGFRVARSAPFSFIMDVLRRSDAASLLNEKHRCFLLCSFSHGMSEARDVTPRLCLENLCALATYAIEFALLPNYVVAAAVMEMWCSLEPGADEDDVRHVETMRAILDTNPLRLSGEERALSRRLHRILGPTAVMLIQRDVLSPGCLLDPFTRCAPRSHPRFTA